MNLSNEVIALIVGLLTTVLVPFLNKRFNNNPAIDSTANVVVSALEKMEKAPAPASPAETPSATPPTPPAASAPTPTESTEPGAM